MKVTKIGIMTIIAALFAAAVLQIAACGGGSNSGSQTTLRVGLTDKNSDDFASVFISIKEVRVVPAGLEEAGDNDSQLPVIAAFATPLEIDVMTLGAGKAFLQKVLGEAVVPPGSYSQVRLVLSENPGSGQPVNYLTLKSDPATRIALKTPSGQQSGLKVIGPFEVKPGQINAILLDFDPNTAIVAKGNGGYNFKPTGIRIVQVADPATLSNFGSLLGDITAFQTWSSATVSVVPDGEASAIAAGQIFSTYTSGQWKGSFSSFVPGGSYRVFVKSSGFATFSSAVTPVTPGAAATIPETTLIPQQ